MSDSFATPWAVAHQAPLSKGFPGKNTNDLHEHLHFQINKASKALIDPIGSVTELMRKMKQNQKPGLLN